MAQVFITRNEISNADLPRVCMKCGCDGAGLVQHSFQWQKMHQRMISMFSNVRVYTVTTCSVPICDQHRRHWLTPLWFFLPGFGVCLLAVLGGVLGLGVFAQALGPLAMVGVVPVFVLFFGGFLFALIGGIIANARTVRITGGDDRGYTFNGIHEDFISALESHRGGRRGGRRKKAARGTDDDDDEELEVSPASLPARSGGPRRRPDDDELEVTPAGASRGVTNRPGSRGPSRPPARSPRGRDDDDDTGPPPRKSSVGLVLGIVGVVLGVLVLACGGVFALVLYGGYEFGQQINNGGGDGGGIMGGGGGLKPPATPAEALATLKNPDRAFYHGEALKLLASCTPEPQTKAEVFATVEPMLTTRDGSRRAAAAQALARWADAGDKALLLKLMNDSQAEVSQAGVDGLVRLKDPAAAGPLAKKLTDFFGRDAAAKSLRALGPVAEKEVVRYYFHPDGGARGEAQRLCQGYGTKDEVILTQAIIDLNVNDRQDAVVTWLQNAELDEARRSQVAKAVEPLVSGGNPFIQEKAAQALARWATKQDAPLLIKHLSDRSDRVRQAVLDPLLQWKDPRAGEGLAQGLTGFDSQKAVEQLKRFGPDAQAGVLKFRFHPDAGVRSRADEVLRAYRTPVEAIIDQAVEDLHGDEAGRRRPASEWLGTAKVVEEKRPAVAAALNNILLEDKDVFYVDTLFKSVSLWAAPESIDALVKVAGETGPFTEGRRTNAIKTLGLIKDPKAADALWMLINQVLKDKKDLTDAGNSLIALGDAAVPKMMDNVDKIKQPNIAARALAWEVLGFIAPKDKLKDLQAIARDDVLTKQASTKALQLIMAR